MRSKLPAVVALLVTLAALVAAGPSASAGTPAASPALTQTAPDPEPREGKYSGTDDEGNTIRFTYKDGRVENFRINRNNIGGADVLAGRWSTSCTDAYFCSWGEWSTARKVVGSWNDGTHGGTARAFVATRVRSR